MNEAEANKKAQEMMLTQRGKFCPLTKDRCRLACECYKIPEVYCFNEEYPKDENKDNWFHVRAGFCTCYALKGACD